MIGERRKKEGIVIEDDLGKGNLFATGLVAGGALAGVAVALLTAGSENIAKKLELVNFQNYLSGVFGPGLYQVIGVLCFVAMALILYRTAMKKGKIELEE